MELPISFKPNTDKISTKNNPASQRNSNYFSKRSTKRSTFKKKAPNYLIVKDLGFHLVAEAGLEPTTFGL